MDELQVKPVGIVRSGTRGPSLVAERGDLEWRGDLAGARGAAGTVSELVIDSEYEGILDGIEDFSHALVLYWAHSVPPEGRSLTKVHPMGRQDLPLVGLFATCSPARPNPICVSAVRIVERRGLTLRVEGLDAVDGSPVVDVKPYHPYYYAVGDAKVSEWMARIMRELGGE
jgi:tRNA-Thr(GGU) m(6)t(6)A37 methyltransferase TsaA